MALRVLHALGTSELGGTERFLVQLLRAHQSAGIESAVFVCAAPGTLAREYQAHAARVIHAPGGPIALISAWRRLLREFEPDVVVLYGAKANLLGRLVRANQAHAVLAAVRSTNLDDSGGGIGRTIERFTSGHVDLYVGNSRQALGALVNVAAERRIYIAPGVELPRATEVPRAPATVPLVLSVANLKPVKRHDALIAASAELLRRGVQHRLRIVGDGPERERLMKLAADAGVAHFVEFTGRDDSPARHYAEADVFALASRWEGTPMAVLEAMAAGLPVVATAVGDIPDLVQDRVAGRVLAEPSPPALADALEEAIWHRDAWGNAARRSAERLSVDRMAAEYARVFQATAAGERAAAGAVRVMRIISRLNVGGPAIHVAMLARGLARANYDTCLVAGRLTPGEGDMSYVARDAGVEITYVPELGRNIKPWSDAVALGKLVRVMRRYRPDVVHTHASKAGALGRIAAGLCNRMPGAGARCAVVHTYHGHTFSGYFRPSMGAAVRGIERTLARITDRIIVLSELQRREIVETYRIAPAAKVRIVPLGLPLDPFFEVDDACRARARTRLGWTNRRVVLCPGRLTSIKNHDGLLRVFRELANRHPETVLVLPGDGERRGELEALARDLGLADRVSFLGWVRDMAELYAGADVVALASRNEGTPVALIESIAAGCPVVATRVGGVPDVVREDCGMLVPLDDAAAFAAAVESTWGSRLTTAARESMRRFSVDRLLTDIHALYQELLRDRMSRQRAAVSSRAE